MSLETDTTIIIKTFERPECLRRLVSSIRTLHEHMHIIVVDDSRSPSPIANTEYHTLPFATGTSVGRNFAVSKVLTKYFMTLDDDFVFNPKTNLQARYNVLEQTDIDLVGTNVADGQCRQGMLIHIQDGVMYRWAASKGESFGHLLYDYVPQCFMAKAERFRQAGGWDQDLIVWDHEALFLNIRNKLKITMLPLVDILHKQSSNKVYQDYRWGQRLARDKLFLNSKYKLKVIRLAPPPNWENHGKK